MTVHGREAMIHPIAGTRKRGETPERDAELITELVNDPKERAEHLMLVDLARNDLGRVCTPGSVNVIEFGVVEKYSNVSHIVSTVTGEVRADPTPSTCSLSPFPHGTVTGAPKVRAMQLIDELEPVRRGIYSGAIGYLDPAGDIDMAICFRTAVMVRRRQRAYVQAGAGVVADSVPALEEKETQQQGAGRAAGDRRRRDDGAGAVRRPRTGDRSASHHGPARPPSSAAPASCCCRTRAWQSAVLPRQRPLRRRRSTSPAGP